MCLLAILYRTSAEAPILVAANREEFFGRPFLPPQVLPGSPQIVCPIDQQAGGTWLGINSAGVLIAATNRQKSQLPDQPRSRGLLCRELLECTSADEAVSRASAELDSDKYAGVNYLCLDRAAGFVVESGDRLEVVQLTPGLHLLANCDLDDAGDVRQDYARELFAPRFPRSAGDFVAAAKFVMAQGVDETGRKTVLVRNEDRGTVCSAIVVMGGDPQAAEFHFAPGPPDRQPYKDLSALLRETLAAGQGSSAAAGR